MSLQRNYYEVLGVPQAATTDEIKKKYRELARQFHPDVVKDKDLGQRVFSQINQAYRVLGDPERRAQYNSTLAAAAASGSSGNGFCTASGHAGAGQRQRHGPIQRHGPSHANAHRLRQWFGVQAAPQGQPPTQKTAGHRRAAE